VAVHDAQLLAGVLVPQPEGAVAAAAGQQGPLHRQRHNGALVADEGAHPLASLRGVPGDDGLVRGAAEHQLAVVQHAGDHARVAQVGAAAHVHVVHGPAVVVDHVNVHALGGRKLLVASGARARHLVTRCVGRTQPHAAEGPVQAGVLHQWPLLKGELLVGPRDLVLRVLDLHLQRLDQQLLLLQVGQLHLLPPGQADLQLLHLHDLRLVVHQHAPHLALITGRGLRQLLVDGVQQHRQGTAVQLLLAQLLLQALQEDLLPADHRAQAHGPEGGALNVHDVLYFGGGVHQAALHVADLEAGQRDLLGQLALYLGDPLRADQCLVLPVHPFVAVLERAQRPAVLRRAAEAVQQGLRNVQVPHGVLVVVVGEVAGAQPEVRVGLLGLVAHLLGQGQLPVELHDGPVLLAQVEEHLAQPAVADGQQLDVGLRSRPDPHNLRLVHVPGQVELVHLGVAVALVQHLEAAHVVQVGVVDALLHALEVL
jgi:hypothetical protein